MGNLGFILSANPQFNKLNSNPLSVGPCTARSLSLKHAFRSCSSTGLKQRVVSAAVSKADLDELEMQVAILNQEMRTAAEEERFKEAAKYRDRLDEVRLKQRCMQMQHKEGLRNSICHRLGQLMQHKRYKYRGVIFGVHPYCQASESWIQSMGVDALTHGRHQPFYQVLADERDRVGGMITYVAQENIALFQGKKGQPDPVQHKQIKQMFESFDLATNRFVPKKKLLEMYPDSIEAREQADKDQ